MLSQQCWIQRDVYRVFSNLYVMMIGKPGTGKGTASYILKGYPRSCAICQIRSRPHHKRKVPLLIWNKDLNFLIPHLQELSPNLMSILQTSLSSPELSLGKDYALMYSFSRRNSTTFLAPIISTLYRCLPRCGLIKVLTVSELKQDEASPFPHLASISLGEIHMKVFQWHFRVSYSVKVSLLDLSLVHGSISNRSEIAFPDSPEAGDNADIKGQLGEAWWKYKLSLLELSPLRILLDWEPRPNYSQFPRTGRWKI